MEEELTLWVKVWVAVEGELEREWHVGWSVVAIGQILEFA